jgi:hypothetical protein
MGFNAGKTGATPQIIAPPPPERYAGNIVGGLNGTGLKTAPISAAITEGEAGNNAGAQQSLGSGPGKQLLGY